MSAGITAAGWAAIAAISGVAVSVYNGQQQAANQKDAMRQAKESADKQAALAEQDMNRGNQKRPDTMGILAAAQQAGKAGPSGTMLTGPQGIDPSALTLGRNTLLGA